MLLKMTVSMSGPEICLSPGDEHEFDGEEIDGVLTGEAGRLVEAGFAVKTEATGVAPAPSKTKRAKASVVPADGDSGSAE